MKKVYKIRYLTYMLRSLNLITQWFIANQDEEFISSEASQTVSAALQDIRKGFTSLVQLYGMYGYENALHREALDKLNSIELRRY